jgi:branched-subunit amino acid aminotransferase/4-amino-4-deoxychorismate lyase
MQAGHDARWGSGATGQGSMDLAPVQVGRVSVDGLLVAPEAAGLPAWFVAASQGLAWFETLRVVDGRVARVERHSARATRTARALGVEPPDAWTDWARELAAELPSGLHALRASFFAAPGFAPRARVVCEARLVEPAPDPLRLVLVARHDRDDDPLLEHKLHARLAWTRARAHARALDAFDALLLDREGRVAEATLGCVLALVDGVVRAPRRGALAGIGRDLALEAARGMGAGIDEGPLLAAELRRAEALVLANAVRECLAVDELVHGLRFPRSRELAAAWNARLPRS